MDFVLQNKPKKPPEPINYHKYTKDALIERIAILEAKLGLNAAIANLPPATNGQLIEELHARLAKDHLLQRKGVER